MANSYTTTDLISTIKVVGNIPPAQTPFTNNNILTLADDELQTAILRQILSVRENYYSTYTDFPIVTDSTYDVPPRAIAGALQKVQIINGTSIYTVARTEIGDQFSTVTSPTGYYSFYIRGNGIVLIPNPEAGMIRLNFYRRPNTLIPTTSAAQILGIAGAVVTVASVPPTITTATTIDLIQDQPGFGSLQDDLTPISTTSTTITFSSLPSTLNIGDWVTPSGQTPVPQIPVEFRPLLIQRVVVKYYEIQGYKDKLALAQKKLDDMEKDVMQLINPRVSEEAKRITSDFNLVGGYRRWRAWRAT